MKIIQYAVYKQETSNAGGKAKNDVFDIALNNNYKASYKPSNYRTIRIIQQILSLVKMHKDMLLLVQYPAVSKQIMTILQCKLKKVHYSIAVIHDLCSIQGVGNKTEDDICMLKNFDCLIVHNKRMKQYVIEQGYKGRLVCLEIFDYLHDINKTITSPHYDHSIIVAGNLDKSKYLEELGKINNCNFHLYGINKKQNLTHLENVIYHGILPSTEIVYKLEGDYGLVWDGDSICECTGVHGKYLLYNNPHKLSLYIAAGKPVIVWEKAAVAQLVKKLKIGLVIHSLEELNNLSLYDQYDEFRNNVLKIKEKIGSGYYMSSALKKAEEGFNYDTEKRKRI